MVFKKTELREMREMREMQRRGMTG